MQALAYSSATSASSCAGRSIEEDYSDATDVELARKLPKPHEIDAHPRTNMSSGRTRPKRALAVAVYNHYKRIYCAAEGEDDVELQKSNIVDAGPHRLRQNAVWPKRWPRILNVPFAIADATSLTEAGYVGEDVENILLKLIQAADYDVERAETRHYLYR